MDMFNSVATKFYVRMKFTVRISNLQYFSESGLAFKVLSLIRLEGYQY
jgi:hypothetical protein